MPEIHDCQRFIKEKWIVRWIPWAKLTYDSLYAIYVSQSLGEVFSNVETAVAPAATPGVQVAPTIAPGAARGAQIAPTIAPGELALDPGRRSPDGQNRNLLELPLRTAVPVAVVFSYGGTYAPLGIEPFFNCLYLYRTGTDPFMHLRAKLVPIGTSDAACRENAQARLLGGKDLAVTRRQHPMFRRDEDYPDAGRWHFTGPARLWHIGRRMQHWIGIKCGAAWCEIGPDGFVPPPDPQYTPEQLQQFGPQLAIKGWHDDQWLAERSGNGIIPSRTRGFIIPHKDLRTYRQIANLTPGVWFPVGHAVLARNLKGYKEKLNLRGGNLPGKMSSLYMCRDGSVPQANQTSACLGGPAPDSATGWWLRISPPENDNTSQPVHLRIRRREYEFDNLVGQGAIRWRWHPQDEIGWFYCPEGCCEGCINSRECIAPAP